MNADRNNQCGGDARLPRGPSATLVRHETDAPCERSACGHRRRLISQADQNVAAWAHVVEIDGAREHFHRRATELYYVLAGEGSVLLDGREHAVGAGSLVHIPAGVVHGARGKLRVLVVGIPDIADDDVYFPDDISVNARTNPNAPSQSAEQLAAK